MGLLACRTQRPCFLESVVGCHAGTEISLSKEPRKIIRKYQVHPRRNMGPTNNRSNQLNQTNKPTDQTNQSNQPTNQPPNQSNQPTNQTHESNHPIKTINRNNQSNQPIQPTNQTNPPIKPTNHTNQPNRPKTNNQSNQPTESTNQTTQPINPTNLTKPAKDTQQTNNNMDQKQRAASDTKPTQQSSPDRETKSIRLLRRAIVNRTCGTHKDLHISLFLPTIFGPVYYGPPYHMQKWSLCSIGRVVPAARYLRGAIVNRTYRTNKHLPGIYLPIFTNNIRSCLLWSPVNRCVALWESLGTDGIDSVYDIPVCVRPRVSHYHVPVDIKAACRTLGVFGVLVIIFLAQSGH